MRIGGLASGMDTDQIVRDLMRAERMKGDRMFQQRQTLEWQRDAYRELNTVMRTFRDNIFNTIMRSANMAAKRVASSNASLVTATATASASNGSFTISSVDRLATAATNASSTRLSGSQKIDPSKSLYEQRALFAGEGGFEWKSGKVEKETISVREARRTIDLKAGDSRILDDQQAMSVKVNGRVFNVVTEMPAEGLKDDQVYFDATNRQLTFKNNLAPNARVAVSYVTESNNHKYFTSAIETFGEDGRPTKENFIFQGTQTLNQVMQEINSSAVGVSMFYDSHSDKIAVQRKQTGNFNPSKASEQEINQLMEQLNVAIGNANIINTSWLEAQAVFQTAQEDYDSNFAREYEVALIENNQELYDTKFNEAIDNGSLPEEAHQFALQYVKEAANEESKQLAKEVAEINLSELKTELVEKKQELDIAFNSKLEADAVVSEKRSELASAKGSEMTFHGSFFTNVLRLDTTNEQGGTNAQFTVNGLQTERNSNTFTISGVTITLRNTFENTPINLDVTTDTDKIFDTVVGFINEYNEMLEKINGKLTEERFRDYTPLTDEQKEAMSEKDIERWEERAMSGLLRGDRILSSGLDRLRVDMYAPVNILGNSNIRQLTDLGITTSTNFMDRGKLIIDESKLRQAIERDPEGVFQLFNSDGPTTADKGLARRMRDGLQSTMRTVAERAGGSFGRMQNQQFTLGRNISNLDDRISNFERRLKQVEDRYWRQFTAMEKAMQQANNQANQMWSMLFGGQ